MKKLRLLLFISTLLVVLSACGTEEKNNADSNNDQQSSTDNKKMQAIEVTIKTIPETLKPSKVSTIQAKVTQGSENVNDAEEVKFEIWKEGSDDHKKIDAEKQGKGLYSIQHLFEEKGVYYVIAHVTARDMHHMPQKKLTVGNVSESKKENEQNKQGNNGSHHNHGDTSNSIATHLTQKNGKLMVHIQKGESPLTKARVRLEVWQGDSKHQFIKTTEGEKGNYMTDFQPNSSGSYKVKVHYEKGDLHGHQKKEIEF